MEKLNTRIGALIKETRKAKGMSQTQLAEILGCTQQNIYKIEKGVMSFGSLENVLDALAIDMNVYTSKRRETPNKQ